MRLVVGASPNWRDYDVYLNGERIDRWWEADDGEGYIVSGVWDDNGTPETTSDDELVTVRLDGVVEFRRRVGERVP